VAQGNHAKLLCECTPELQLFCVDVWEDYPGYHEYANRINRYYLQAQKTLAPYNCILVKKFSMEAVEDFQDRSLDFVYIDGAHDYLSVAQDVCKWTPKVKIGGIVFGHDYMRLAWSGQEKHWHVLAVKDVIPSYCYSKAVNPWFVLGMEGKPDGLYRERTQSWMFVRQETDRI
jgi:hypothetical protein